MAYELKYGQSLKQGDEDEEQRNSLFGAAANATAATAAQPTAGAGAAQPGGSGRFVNFERYLNANLGSADQTAGKIEHDVNNTAGLADAQIKTATRTQTGRIAQSTMPFGGEQLVLPSGSEHQSNISGGIQTDHGQGLASEPAPGWGVTPEQAREKSQTKFNAPTYTSTQEYQNAAAATSKANQQLGGLKSQEGLQGMLQERNKNNPTGYSQGMSKLDAALVGGVGAQRFDALRKQYGNLDKMLSGSVSSMQDEYNKGYQTTLGSAQRYGAMADEGDAAIKEQGKQDAAAKAGGDLSKQRNATDYGTLSSSTNPNMDYVDQDVWGKMSDEEWGQYMAMLEAANSDGNPMSMGPNEQAYLDFANQMATKYGGHVMRR